MADDAPETPHGTSSIHVMNVPNVPGQSLVRLVGRDLDGREIDCEAQFDTVALARQMFGPMFADALTDVLETAKRRVGQMYGQPSSLVELEIMQSMEPFKSLSLVQLKQAHAILQACAKDNAASFADLVLRYADLAVDHGLRRLEREQDAPAPALAESEPGSPGHADTSSLADGASSSMAVVGEAGDLLFERSPGPGAAAA